MKTLSEAERKRLEAKGAKITTLDTVRKEERVEVKESKEPDNNETGAVVAAIKSLQDTVSKLDKPRVKTVRVTNIHYGKQSKRIAQADITVIERE